MNGLNPNLSSINQIADQYLKGKGRPEQVDTNKGPSFREILNEKRGVKQTNELKFSKHASSRLDSRNIELSANQIERLLEGTSKAENKGINDSLVIVDDLAFIVNVPNKTVITAINQNESENNIFTNIDGAVIA
ncbi:MAG: flagellar protein [Lachnospiraceae bacterium]|nr:flagellar protein [Lachnospiraceae bacterium]